MIAPQELKQNNLIRDIESGRIGAVLTIGEKKCTIKMPFSKLSQSYEEFEPIELTEHWLLKFGLKNTETGWEYIYGHSNRISVILFKKFASVGISGPFGLIHVQVKYVNQFQNLTFAITGEELKIKES